MYFVQTPTALCVIQTNGQCVSIPNNILPTPYQNSAQSNINAFACPENDNINAFASPEPISSSNINDANVLKSRSNCDNYSMDNIGTRPTANTNTTLQFPPAPQTSKSQCIMHLNGNATHNGNAFQPTQTISQPISQPNYGKSMANTDSSTARRNMHLNNKSTPYVPNPIQCKLCGKTFASKSNLRIHYRIHTGERRFKCLYPNCNKRFTQKHSLHDHKLIHSGEKPFLCEICYKRFRVKWNLTRHLRSHANKKSVK